MSEPRQQCSKIVYRGRWGGSRCSIRPTITADGKPYCGLHNPEAEKKRRDILHAKYSLQSARMSLKYKIESAQFDVAQSCLDAAQSSLPEEVRRKAAILAALIAELGGLK